ncbi:MAG: hypothetical protein ACWA5P_02095 [bacterium]
MRINGFNQFKAFFQWIIENPQNDVRAPQIALYSFLMNQNNKTNWSEWISVPMHYAMNSSGISSKNTYYDSLNKLESWGLIKYQKGKNNYCAAKISLEVLFWDGINTQQELSVGINKDSVRESTDTQYRNQSVLSKGINNDSSVPQSGNNILTNNYKHKLETNNLNNDDDFKPIQVLIEKYKSDENLLNAIVQNKELKYRDHQQIFNALEVFRTHLKSMSRNQDTWSNFTIHFLNWSKKRKNTVSTYKSPTDNIVF